MLIELAVGPLGEKHARHPSASDLAHDGVWADSLTRPGLRVNPSLGDQRRRCGAGRRFKEATRISDAAEKILDFPPQIRSANASRVEEGRPVLRLALEGGVEDITDALPAIRIATGAH